VAPRRESGHQELLENIVNQSIWAADPSKATSDSGR